MSEEKVYELKFSLVGGVYCAILLRGNVTQEGIQHLQALLGAQKVAFPTDTRSDPKNSGQRPPESQDFQGLPPCPMRNNGGTHVWTRWWKQEWEADPLKRNVVSCSCDEHCYVNLCPSDKLELSPV